MQTEIIATPAGATAIITPAAFAARNLEARRRAGRLAVVAHATYLEYAAAQYSIAHHGAMSAGPALRLFAGAPTDDEIGTWADGIDNVIVGAL